MLRSENIKVAYDSHLLSVSDTIIKKINDRDYSDKIVELYELQVEVENISDTEITNLEMHVKYYNSSGKFIGDDSDLRLEPLPQKHKHVLSTIPDIPPETAKAEMSISCKEYGVREKIGAFLTKPWVLALIILLFLINRFYK